MYCLRKKKMKSICPGQRKKNTLPYNSVNGFMTVHALLCFFLLLQIISLLSLYLLNNAWLIQADQQSTLDLSCLSQAKAMIQHNQQIEKCHLNPDDLLQEQIVNIQGVDVLFRDEKTFIDCTYQIKKKKVQMRIYYDSTGILNLDFL